METGKPSPDVDREGNPGAELRKLVVLAWPVVLGQVGSMAMGVVDVAMVGRLGAASLAAMAMAHTWGFSSLILARGATHGLDPLVAQAHGAGDRSAASRALVRGLVMASVLAVPVTGLHFVAEWGLGVLRQPQELLGMAGAWCAVLGLGVAPMLWFLTLRQFLQGLELMRPATEAVLVANVANVLLNHGLMTGAWGLPALGAIGCAWSSVFCQFLMLAWLLVRVRSLTGKYRIPLQGVVTWRSMKHLLGLGLPVGLQISVEVWAFNVTNVMMGWLGPTVLAGHTLAMSLATISFMVPLGISSASATRVGNLLGSGLPWQRTGWLSVGLGVVVMGVSAMLFLAFPEGLAGLYTGDPTILVVAVTLIPLAGLFQVFDGAQVVSFGVLRGAGDVRLPLLVPLVAYWLVGLPLSWWLAFHLEFGPEGVWWGLIGALAVAAGLLAWRIRVTGKRGGYLVVSSDSPDP